MTTQKTVAHTRRSMTAHAAPYLVSIAVAAAIAGSASPSRAMAADGPAAPAADDQKIEEVIVTGSRIARSRDLSAPSPVVTVGKDALENTSQTGVEAVLNQMPQFVPTTTQFTSGIQGSATGNPGSVTLNLRGVGPNRNLVLFDGRRAQPSDATLAIDINTIPASAIESVEVITGGASAVYGPDAMAGVVNFILKKNFPGSRTGCTARGNLRWRRCGNAPERAGGHERCRWPWQCHAGRGLDEARPGIPVQP